MKKKKYEKYDETKDDNYSLNWIHRVRQEHYEWEQKHYGRMVPIMSPGAKKLLKKLKLETYTPKTIPGRITSRSKKK